MAPKMGWMIFRVAKGPFVEDFYQCVTHGFYTDRWQEQLYTTFTLVFMFIIPLLILIGTYLSTFMTISSPSAVRLRFFISLLNAANGDGVHDGLKLKDNKLSARLLRSWFVKHSRRLKRSIDFDTKQFIPN
uniref:G-protein coupled receptors family 1 profile domain-containing protein n=1 Tax=Anopheles maculatus TaxID=74869 RepID=A0A182SSE0_9DIPT